MHGFLNFHTIQKHSGLISHMIYQLWCKVIHIPFQAVKFKTVLVSFLYKKNLSILSWFQTPISAASQFQRSLNFTKKKWILDEDLA